ncbi:MAG: murein biosynthesis integral membrane protein MurJ [Planctomycetaceae bacterium]
MTEPAAPTEDEEHSQGAMLSGLRIVSLLTLGSRITGLVRDSGMAALFGNGPIMDAFTVAFRIPNLARRLFGEGALTAAFLPALVREMEHKGRDSAWRLASALFVVLAVVLTLIVVAAEAALLIGYSFATSAESQLLIGLAAVMVPYLIVICLAAQVGAVMHSLNHFKWPAFIPVLLNLVWIVGVFAVAPFFSTPRSKIYSIAAVVVVGGVMQFVVPLPALFRMGFRFDRTWLKKSDPHRAETIAGVKSIAATMLPVLAGLSVTQFNSVLDSLVAWWFANAGSEVASSYINIEPGTAAALYFGQRMYQFPLGVLGIALGTVLFPRLARHAERNRVDLLGEDLTMGLRLVICIAIPASVGLCLLAEPLTDLLFRHGNFDDQDARQTTAMIRGYGCAVWAYCGLLILNRAFYAIDDQKTPLKVGMWAMGLNLILNLILITIVGGVGLAFGTAISSAVQCLIVLRILQQRIGGIDLAGCGVTVAKTAVATTLMAVVCLLTVDAIPSGTGIGMRTVRLLTPVGTSIAAYWVLSRALRMREVDLLLKR